MNKRPFAMHGSSADSYQAAQYEKSDWSLLDEVLVFKTHRQAFSSIIINKSITIIRTVSIGMTTIFVESFVEQINRAS